MSLVRLRDQVRGQPGALGAPLQLGGEGQGRLAERHAVQRRPSRAGGRLALGRLDLVPVAGDVLRAGHGHAREHVRVPPDQLGHDGVRHVVHGEAGPVGPLLRDAGVEHHLQQHVTEFAAQRRPVTALQRVQRLVRLLDEVRGQRLVGLLRIPGAPPPQRVHHRDQGEQLPAGQRGRAVQQFHRGIARPVRPAQLVGERDRARRARPPGARAAPAGTATRRHPWRRPPPR